METVEEKKATWSSLIDRCRHLLELEEPALDRDDFHALEILVHKLGPGAVLRALSALCFLNALEMSVKWGKGAEIAKLWEKVGIKIEELVLQLNQRDGE